MKTYSVSDSEKGHSFVKGNTKYLRDMSQDELKILAENGDPRVIVKEAETEAVQLITEEAPAEGQPEDAPAGKSRKSNRNSPEADPAA